MFSQDIKKYSGCLFILLILASSFYYVFSVKPPFSSPDEGNHISRASALLHGSIILHQKDGEGNSGGVIDNPIDQYAVWFGQLMHSNSPAEEEAILNKMKQLKFNDLSYFHSMPNVAFYFPAIYAPQALSLLAGKTINISVYHTYAIMNFVTFALILCMLWLAKSYSEIPTAVFIAMLFPMSLFQIMSPTIDGLTIGLSVLSLSIFYGYLHGRITIERKAPMIIMFLSLFLVASSRANLIPMSLLPLWLFVKSKDKKFLAGFILLFVSTLAWTVFNIATVRDFSMTNHVGYSNSQLMVYYISHPVEMISIFFKTLSDNVYLESYLKGLFGSVAWQDAQLKEGFYDFFCYLGLFALIISLKIKNISIDWKTSLFMFLMFLSTFLLIFFALLVQWSPFPTDRIVGVQGRYFIIPMIILFYSMYSGKGVAGWRYIPIIALFVFSTWCVRNALIDRFFL